MSSPQLRKQAADISPKCFVIFPYIDIDRKHYRHASFTWVLFCICVDDSDTIINDLDTMSDNNNFLCNNITEPPLLKDWTTSQHNHTLVIIVALSILYYAQSEQSNIIQRVNTQFAFANNILKRFVESFHQMGTLVSYESLCYDF